MNNSKVHHFPTIKFLASLNVAKFEYTFNSREEIQLKISIHDFKLYPRCFRIFDNKPHRYLESICRHTMIIMEDVLVQYSKDYISAYGSFQNNFNIANKNNYFPYANDYDYNFNHVKNGIDIINKTSHESIKKVMELKEKYGIAERRGYGGNRYEELDCYDDNIRKQYKELESLCIGLSNYVRYEMNTIKRFIEINENTLKTHIEKELGYYVYYELFGKDTTFYITETKEVIKEKIKEVKVIEKEIITKEVKVVEEVKVLEESQCCVCLEESNGVLSCGHITCAECFKALKTKKCPCCQKDKVIHIKMFL